MLNLSTGLFKRPYWLTLTIAAVVFVIISESLLRLFVIVIPNTEAYRANSVFWGSSQKVAIGDSHIYRGFILSEDVTNLGRGGTSIYELDSILRYFYEWRKPGQLVIEASHQFFSVKNKLSRITGEGYKPDSPPPLMYIFEPVYATQLKQIYEGLTIPSNLKKLSKKRKSNENDKTTTKNWDDINNDDRIERTKRRAKKQRPVWDKEAYFLLNKYEKLISHLKNKGVSICLLRTPLSKEYIDIYDNFNDFRMATQYFMDIASKNSINYVDFQELGMVWNDRMFLNQDHITPQTSIFFSQKVWDKCFKKNKGL